MREGEMVMFAYGWQVALSLAALTHGHMAVNSLSQHSEDSVI